jgi:hypothetical protein
VNIIYIYKKALDTHALGTYFICLLYNRYIKCVCYGDSDNGDDQVYTTSSFKYQQVNNAGFFLH